MGMDAEKYKIGDVSRILGISTDLLRYYEKKGVVSPEKDKTNDYRYYDAWDINFLLDCMWYKNFGYAIDQVSEMISTYTADDINQLFLQTEDKLRQQIEHSQMLLKRSQQHRERLAKIQQWLGKVTLDQSPEIMRYLHRYNFYYNNSPELQEVAVEWLKYMPFSNRCFEISQNVLLGKVHSGDYQWGSSLSTEYAEYFGVKEQGPVQHIPSCTSLYSVFSSSGKGAFTARHLDYIVDYAQAHNYEIIGPARGNLITSVVSGDKLTGYFEVWIPIA